MQDDLRYRICPPFFSLRGMRVDSPTSNIRAHYEHDANFFKSNPHRRLIIRPAFLNEFDIAVEPRHWFQLPHLHCLVNQLSAGVHLLTPVYRGKAFFGEVSKDSEVAMIVSDMALRGGIDKREFEQFEHAFNSRIQAAISQVKEAVN